MTRRRHRFLVPLLFLAGVAALAAAVARYGLDLAAAPSGATLPPGVARPLVAGEKVSFLELGSVGCKPCEAMVPVMEAVRERFPGRVEVIFHDVRRDPAKAGEYRVRLIPTQVFLRPDGSEFFRHEGYLPETDVVAVLERMGVR